MKTYDRQRRHLIPTVILVMTAFISSHLIAADSVVDGTLYVRDTAIIGTNNASATDKLHVQGNARVEGLLYVMDRLSLGGYNTIIQSGANGLSGGVSNVTETVAIGYGTLFSASGAGNTAVGFASAYASKGDNNTAVGRYSLNSSSGSENVALGYSSATRIHGNGNTAVGRYSIACYEASTGSWNTALGWGAMESERGVGTMNVAVGAAAMQYSGGGSNNVAIGVASMIFAPGNIGNIALGYYAGMFSTYGQDNIFIGNHAGKDVSNLSNVTLIGKGLSATRSDVMILGNNQDVGIGTSDPAAKLHVVGDVRIDGDIELGGGVMSGISGLSVGSASVASGRFSFAQGQTNIASGSYSHVAGSHNTASGYAAHAEGAGNIASGGFSHAEGNCNRAADTAAHAEGAGTLAFGYASHAEGESTKALGEASHAEGCLTIASNECDHAEGYMSVASGALSHAEGHSTRASGVFAHSQGNETVASGESSHAQGMRTVASGTAAHAEGDGSLASGYAAHAESGGKAYGLASHAQNAGKAYGDHSHAEGGSIASNIFAHAEGNACLAGGSISHAQGLATKATGSFSHSQGQFTTASGSASHTEGRLTLASGSAAHAEGQNSTASGDYSHAEGFGTLASGSCTHAAGYNAKATNHYSYVWSDGQDVSSTTNFEYTVHARGGIRLLGGRTQVENAVGGMDAVNYRTLTNHLATTGGAYLKADGTVPMSGNLRLNGRFLSGDGGNEGVAVAANGYVGVGLTNPTAPMQVLAANAAATAVQPLYLTTSDTYAQDKGGGVSFGGKYDAAGNRAVFASLAGRKENGTTNNYAGYLQFVTRAAGASPAERMRITSSGRVGLGTTAPAEKLHVTAGNARVDNTAAKVILKDSDSTGAAGQGWLSFQNSAGTETAAIGDWLTTSSDVYVKNAVAGGHIRLVPNASGNVAVGDIAPAAKLHVSGSARIDGPVAGTTASSTNYFMGRLGVGTSAAAEKLHVTAGNARVDNSAAKVILKDSDSTGAAGQGWLSFQNSAGTETAAIGDWLTTSSDVYVKNAVAGGHIRLVPNASGNVAVGDIAPAAKLHVSGSARIDGPVAGTTASSTNYFMGRVGIGTNAPAEMLHVAGAVRVGGLIRNVSNPVLAQDAATKAYVDGLAGGGSGDFESDGSVAMTGNLNVGSHRVVNVANAVNDGDAVSKAFLLATLQNLPPMGDISMGSYTNRP